MKTLIITILFSLSFAIVYAGTNWELKKDKEGIKVFSGSVPNSNIKAVKAECVLNTSLSRLTALLLDAKAHEQWVYSTKSSYLIKKVSDQEQIYYSEMSMPWPIVNRDVVVDLKITQNPVTREVAVDAIVVTGYVPIKDGIIRVPLSKVNWAIIPIGNSQVKIEYTAQADPGGSVPAWAVNMFCDKGPFETFKKLKSVLASDAYKDEHLSFIKD
jgi:hypothetical protein